LLTTILVFCCFTQAPIGRKLISVESYFMNVMFAGFLGGWEWLIVILAVLILFGAKRIPELAKGLGSGIKEFKKAAREVTEEVQNAGEEPPKPASKNGQPSSTVAQSQQPSSPPKA
jgi:sec-independent protein translocase protein TatA